jgi:hypothetical protein
MWQLLNGKHTTNAWQGILLTDVEIQNNLRPEVSLLQLNEFNQ